MAHILVYLVHARKNTVVPEKFVYSLHDIKLKNLSVNRNQNYRIYFSQELFDLMKNGEEPIDMQPNFSLPITKNYPLENGVTETCFIGRTKKFYGKLYFIFILLTYFHKDKNILMLFI